MKTFSMLLALCAGNSPVTGEFPAQRPVTRIFDVFFDLRPNKPLSKQSWGWWFEMPSHSLWCHCNVPRILSQNGRNDFEGQGQWPSFSIPAESIPGCMFCSNLVILAQTLMSYTTDKPNFLEFWVKMAKMTLKVTVNDLHFQYQLRVSQDACLVSIWRFQLKSVKRYHADKVKFTDRQTDRRMGEMDRCRQWQYPFGLKGQGVKMLLKMSSSKQWPFCPGRDELNPWRMLNRPICIFNELCGRIKEINRNCHAKLRLPELACNGAAQLFFYFLISSKLHRQCSAKFFETWGQVTHHTGKYGNTENFSGVGSITLQLLI